MSKLNSKSDVMEWYWPDYLDYCLRSRKAEDIVAYKSPTVDGFWLWYITYGPLGLKNKGLFYTKTEVEYV
jgi:hypothetical protein